VSQCSTVFGLPVRVLLHITIIAVVKLPNYFMDLITDLDIPIPSLYQGWE
jgi:hypothetical protein